MIPTETTVLVERVYDISIHIYRRISVCLFVMHANPVIASGTKLPVARLQFPVKVEKELVGERGEVGEDWRSEWI
jgi:hypothetical protein